MKHWLRVALSLFVVTFLLVTVPTPTFSADNTATISGDKVFIDNSSVYLSASPHTISSSGWVEFELRSKLYSGNTDILWGFSDDRVTVSSPQVWMTDMSHQVVKSTVTSTSTTVKISNVISIVELTAGSVSPDIGNQNNTKLARVTVASARDFPFYQEGIPSQEKVIFVIAYNTQTKQGQAYSFTYSYDKPSIETSTAYYDDWKSFNVTLSSTSLSHKGMSRWESSQLDVPIQSNTSYKVRVWVEIPFTGTARISGEYFFGLKPSGESLSEAAASGHLYLLDPWYNSSWLSRKSLTVTGTAAGAQTNYQMMLNVYKGAGTDNGSSVYLNGKCQDDFDDLRFTKADYLALLDYWVESYVSGTSAVVWVELDSIPISPGTATFHFYYNNAAATSASNGVNTFLLFDDFTAVSIDLTKWDGYTAGASLTGGIMTYGGDGINVNALTSIQQFGPTVAMRSKLALRSTNALVKTWGLGYSTDPHYSRAYYDNSPLVRTYSKDGATASFVSTNWVIDNNYHTVDVILRGGVNMRTFQDEIERSNSPKTTNPSNSSALEVQFAGKRTSALGGEYAIDWVLARNYIYAEPTITSWGSVDIESPSGLTATFISPTQVDLLWIKGGSANNTLVRAKFYEYPLSVIDGYQVYYGQGTSHSDTALNLDITFGPVYYRAWSENTTGFWSEDYADAQEENPDMEGIVEQLTSLNTLFGLITTAFQSISSVMALDFEALMILGVYGLALWRQKVFLNIVAALVGFFLAISWIDQYLEVSLFLVAVAGYFIWISIASLFKGREV